MELLHRDRQACSFALPCTQGVVPRGLFGLNQNDFGFIPHAFHAIHHSASAAFCPQDRANQKHGLREYMGQLLDRDGVRLLRTVLFGETDEHLKVLMIQP